MVTWREKLAGVIEAVLANEVSAAEAVEMATHFLTGHPHDAAINDAFHLLIHFREDEDIRSSEPAYAQRQRDALRRNVERLRGA